jgi:uncharacterized protein (TIGR02246 family)
MTMDEAAITDFFTAYEQAWSSGDPTELPTLMTDDVVMHDPFAAEPLDGKAAVETFLANVLVAAPDFTMEMQGVPMVAIDGSRYAVVMRISGHMTGPLESLGFAPTNTSIEFDDVHVLELRDGKIGRLDVVIDTLDVGRQLGAVPPAGSFMDRMGVRMQHLAARGMRRKAAKH